VSLPSYPPTTPSTDGWHRLHPLSPVARIGRIVPAFAIGLIISGAGRRSNGHSSEVVYAIVAGLAIVIGVIHWLVTRWRIDGDTLRIETGLIRRDSRRLPLARIQAVDIVRPLTARVLGISELRIRLAGSGATDGRLAYLSEPEAAALRERLLSGYGEQHADAPARPPEVRMASVDSGRLVASVMLSLVSIVLTLALVVLLVLAAVAPKTAAAALGVLAVYLFSFAGVVWRRIVGQFHFEAMNAFDGVHIRRGLFQTISETIPLARIQAVRQVEPILWRPFGWCRLEVDIAGAGSRKQRGEGTGVVRKALLPVGTHQEAWDLVVRVMGGPDPDRTPPPVRARYKAPLSYHFLSAGYDDTHAVCVTGRVNRATAFVPLEKTQSIRRIQGPVQRRFGLATVHVDVAGRRTRGEFRDRTVEEADALVEKLSELSRLARLRTAAAPVGAPTVAPPPASAPAGWFADPSGRHQWRYWDGSAWTDHVGNDGESSLDPR
jgi:putative membrane protein